MNKAGFLGTFYPGMLPLKMVVQFIAWVFFISHYAIAQEKVGSNRNAIYVELSSVKPIFSINYDRVIHMGKKVSYSCRLGIFIAKDELYFPIGLNVLAGKKASHFEGSFVCAPYIKHFNAEVRGVEDSDLYLNVIPGIGYRFQHRTFPLFFRLSLGPTFVVDIPSKDLLEVESEFHASAFFALGYSF